ncbi:MAG: energy transducer TonB [Chlorogloeopsis fritschii C42_A2020_084]|uniref:energy transducer TonB n=1 Tax=Chlorogloeopsis fritschii TaxID=1124 RepID=UPI0019EFB2A4|nr:energy transducer TonB [Chlorogloeopsis fritschii]MBF2007669.1 energy transducer TonB [Chlorogloeopsis fritschii C42_A2020_084]
MSVSNVAGLQREKEAKALKSFLTFSIVGSLMLHIGVLASGIVNLLTRVPDLEEEPIELTFVEPETPETPEPPKEPVKETKIEPIQPPVKVQTPIEPPVKPAPQPITPVQKPAPQPVQKDPPVAKAPQQPVEQAKPTVTAPQTTTATNTSPAETPVLTQPSNDELKAQLRGIRDSRYAQETVGVAEKPAATNPSPTVTFGTRTGTGSERRKRETFATAPTPPRIPTESNRGSGDGRAACRECNTKYPEQARRRGVEGRVEVAVDTDDQGNVTNVRLTRSSGNRQLDEAHLRQAREWKLKPSEAGRRGVTIGTEYAIQGSRRYREVQEQKKRRQRERRNQENVAEQRRQRLEATSGSNTDVPTSSRRRRRLETPAQQTATPRNTESGFNRLPQRQNVGTSSPARTQTATPPRQRLRESLRRTPQNNVERSSASTSQPTQNRRRRRQQGQQGSSSNSSANRLRDALRRNNQPSAPASTTPTTP